MATNASAQFVRGGQTTQHWWRMGLQVFRFSLVVGVAVFVIVYGALVLRNYEINRVQMAYGWWISQLTVINKADPDRIMRTKMPDGSWVEAPAADVYRSPEHRNTYYRYEANAKKFIWWSAPPSIVAMFLSMVLFWFTGKRLGKEKHVRGSRLVSPRELSAWSEQKWKDYTKEYGKGVKKAPRYTISGIPFPPNTVEAQTGIFGTTGVGKTTAIKELLSDIRNNNGRVIIYDSMGSMVRDFYDPETDIIINPFDARSHVWTPFLDADSSAGIAQIAEVLIPQRPEERDPFWSQTARLVFEYAARRLLKEGKATNSDLRRAIMDLPASKLEELLTATPGHHFFGKHIEKTSASIRANMITSLRFLEFMRDDGPQFSMRDWVREDSKPGIVFLTGDAEHSAATRNIISASIEVAANALMTCGESRDPRLWFIIDELPSLNNIPFMVQKIAQVRQFGGAFVLGYQVYSQLEVVYGDKGARSISGNLNNRVVFNTPDAQTAKFFSESLGSQDLIETRQNVTVGAHVARDGQGMTENRIERPLVTASEIQAMAQHQCYVRFAYDAPTALTKIVPNKNAAQIAEPFIKYTGPGFGSGEMDAALANKKSGFRDLPTEAQRAEFDAYFGRVSPDNMSTVEEGFSARYTEDDRPMLWRHFATERTRGMLAKDIGPPAPSGEMMGSLVSDEPDVEDVPPYDPADGNEPSPPLDPNLHTHGLVANIPPKSGSQHCEATGAALPKTPLKLHASATGRQS